MSELSWLSLNEISFPPVNTALEDPNGLLAVGGDLSPSRLIEAYRQGVFPWYDSTQPILWWSPDPRAVLLPENLKVSRSLKKTLRKGIFQITVDKAFERVIRSCAAPRINSSGTWITPEMQQAYCKLHRLGLAHSVETWHNDELVGGLYGVSIGSLYFGESMFSRVSDASKVAFVYLVKNLERFGCPLIDCQVPNDHLMSLGATEMPREQFVQFLDQYIDRPWQGTEDAFQEPWELGPRKQ